MANTHSPEQWRAEEQFDDDGESLGLHIKEGGDIVATVPGIGVHDFERAGRIVRAWNSFDELVEFAQLVKERIAYLRHTNEPISEGFIKLLEQKADAALSKATGEAA